MRSRPRARRFRGWAKQSAYLRGQILYRAAEMLEMRRGELQDEMHACKWSAAERRQMRSSPGD